MTRASALEGLDVAGGDRKESYTPGEMPLEVRLARDAAACPLSVEGQAGAVLSDFIAAARHSGEGFDHNFFLEAYIAEVSGKGPEEREERMGPVLSRIIQALYDEGRNGFMLAIDGWGPGSIAEQLAGTPERRLALSYRGRTWSFGAGSQYCSFALDGLTMYAGAGSDYCNFDLGDSEGMVGYGSFACRFSVRSVSQIPFPVSQALDLYRHHEGMRLPLDCAFRVRDVGELDAKGIGASIRRRVWEHVLLGKYKNAIINEGDAASAGEAMP